MFLNLQSQPELQILKFGLSAYIGTNNTMNGCCILHITNGIISIPVLLHVADNDSPTIPGFKNQ